jgi:hypothetical protein
LKPLLIRMSRFIRVAGRMIDLSGLHGIWLGPDHICRSRITLFYPRAPTETIQYELNNWADAEKDKNTLEEALEQFKKLKIDAEEPRPSQPRSS